MKNTLKITAVVLTALIILFTCILSPAATVEAYAAVSDLDTSVSARDASGDYDVNEAVVLMPEDDLTITEAGVYILSGTYENKMIVVDVSKDDKVQFVLQNAVLTNANGPAIYVRSADKVFITAAEGTENSISDGTSYELTDEETTLDAAVFSKEDLTINGSGKLTINGNYKHAVVSKDDLVVTAKDLTVNAVNVGLFGKDSVRLSAANVTVTAGTDGIRSKNGTDTSLGFVSAENSAITIQAGKDGIQAETVFLSNNSVIAVRSGGGGTVKKTSSADSYKGIKAGIAIIINGGTYAIDSLDDAIHTNGTVSITAGTFVLRSSDDGIHADEYIDISGGTFDVDAYEGIEATYVRISGGEITVQASDDGINAARKSATYTPTVEITGGTITVTMGAGDTDGIDSNGNIIISGGTIYVNANSPFDYDGSASFTGGTVYVNGSQVTSLPNQMMGGFGGQGGFHGGMGSQGGFWGSSGEQNSSDYQGGYRGKPDEQSGSGYQGGFGSDPGEQGGFRGGFGGHH